MKAVTLVILVSLVILLFAAILAPSKVAPVPAPVSQAPPPAPQVPQAPPPQALAPKVPQSQAPIIEPELQRLQTLVTTLIQNPTQWDILIAVGDIYRKGAFPRYLPNEELAMRCFKLAAMCPDGQVAGLGQSKYIEAYDDPINILDKAGKKLPVEYGLQTCQLAEIAIKSTPWQMFEKPKEIKKTQPSLPPQILQLPHYKNDSQNVHDHSITKATLKNLEKLESHNIDNIDKKKIKEEINKLDLNETIKKDAIRVIDNLSLTKHSSFNKSEQDTLKMVWKKIQTQESPQLRANLTETLVQQLANSIENGHIVCSSGKITRIMGTLDGTLNETTARPMWAIRDELGYLASKIRNDYNSEERMRQEFEKQVRKEYIDKLGMSENIMQPLIDEYILGF